MRLRNVVAALTSIFLLTMPVLAQRAHTGGGRVSVGGGMQGGARAGGGNYHAPQLFHGGPRGPMQWNEFHHDTAPAKVSPHRFGVTNLPRPSAWAGNIHDFDLARWQGGSWQHVSHGGRYGWWWVVGPDWFFFDEPVYPYPDLYTPFGEPIGWWYWCDPYTEYYPFVTDCPVPWESVMPQE